MKRCFISILFILFIFSQLQADPALDAVNQYVIEHKNELNDYSLTILTGEKIIFQSDLNMRFNQGSLSKIFTTLLFARMKKMGLLDYDTTLGEILTSGKYSEYGSLTIGNILSHTSGIAQRGFATAEPQGYVIPGSDPSDKLQKIAEPDSVIIYSSTAFILLEEVVSEIYDDSFTSVMEREVLRPLELQETGYRHDSSAVTGFNNREKTYCPYNTVMPAAGNIISSGSDMAGLIQFLLIGRDGFLDIQDLAELYQIQFSHFDLPYGRGLGFAIKPLGKEKAAYHDGGAPGTNSRIMILPERNAAFHLSYNNNSYKYKNELTEVILDVFEINQGNSTVFSESPHRPIQNQLEGYYIPLDNSFNTIEKISSLFNQIRVRNGGESLLVGSREYKGTDPYFRERSETPLTLSHMNGQNYMLIGNTAFVKAPLFQSLPFQMILLVILLIISAIGILINKGRRVRVVYIMFLLLIILYFFSLIIIDFWILAYGMPVHLLLLSSSVLLLALSIPFFKASFYRLTALGPLCLVLWLHQYNLLILIQ